MKLGILGSAPHPPEVPVIVQGNRTAQEASRLATLPIAPGHMSMKQHAIQRWENEGGEIPAESAGKPSGKASLRTGSLSLILMTQEERTRE